VLLIDRLILDESAYSPKPTRDWLASMECLATRRLSLLNGINRPGMSGDSISWKGWSHVRWFFEKVPAGAA
jgi:hypothetical protein